MPTAKDIYRAIDGFAPFDTAEPWDNSGLLLGNMDAPVGGVLVALDATVPVADEARALGANLIVTHHPVIFDPVRRVDSDSALWRLIASGISVISAHTNLDMAPGGVNDALAQRLGLTDVRPFDTTRRVPFKKITVFVNTQAARAVYEAMSAAGAGALGNYSGCAFTVEGTGCFLPGEGAQPAIGRIGDLEQVRESRIEMLVAPERIGEVVAAMRAAHPYEEPAYDIFDDFACMREYAFGRIGELERDMAPADFARHVKGALGLSGLRFSEGTQPVRTVAVCGGSGAELLGEAHALGAQALVTGESRHHFWLEAAQRGVTLVDAGHFGTENVVVEPLAQRLRAVFPGLDVHVSGVCTDGVRYA